VDACTVTAPDVITAFAVPNPNCPSQDQSVFSGLVALRVAPPSLSPSLLRISQRFIFGQPFQPSTGVTLNAMAQNVNAAFRCKPENIFGGELPMQSAEG
jgi:hypothetical protein